jgi:hypothetical protein
VGGAARCTAHSHRNTLELSCSLGVGATSAECVVQAHLLWERGRVQFRHLANSVDRLVVRSNQHCLFVFSSSRLLGVNSSLLVCASSLLSPFRCMPVKAAKANAKAAVRNKVHTPPSLSLAARRSRRSVAVPPVRWKDPLDISVDEEAGIPPTEEHDNCHDAHLANHTERANLQQERIVSPDLLVPPRASSCLLVPPLLFSLGARDALVFSLQSPQPAPPAGFCVRMQHSCQRCGYTPVAVPGERLSVHSV